MFYFSLWYACSFCELMPNWSNSWHLNESIGFTIKQLFGSNGFMVRKKSVGFEKVRRFPNLQFFQYMSRIFFGDLNTMNWTSVLHYLLVCQEWINILGSRYTNICGIYYLRRTRLPNISYMDFYGGRPAAVHCRSSNSQAPPSISMTTVC